MTLKTFLLFSLFLTIKGQDYQEDKVIAEMEIANLELQDDCENLANVVKVSLIGNTFSEKIKARVKHGDLLKRQSKNLRHFEDDIPSKFLRNWTFFVQAGDGLLPETDWSTLVAYDVSNDQLMHTSTVHCKNDTQNCVFIKNGYERLLQSSKNQTLLKKSWSAWQTLLSSNKNQFPKIVNLISTAAAQNGKEDAKSYWEMLVDKQDAYISADELWEHIKPFYFKLHNFVKTRLFRFYNITDDSSNIPAFLLGSNFGSDWSEIADVILPHPLIHHKADTYLNKTTIGEIYKMAEELTTNLSLGGLGRDFWTNSLFNMTFCENHVISFCVQEHSELLTCDKTSWVSYLDAFEVAVDVTLRNMDYVTLAQSNLRFSVVDEAVKGLGAVLAVQNLRNKGIWDSNLFLRDESNSNSNEMTELLLIALRVLPKLPFYLAADKWRLDVIENGGDKMEERWWEFRKEYQGVEGVLNNEADFLGDSFMTSNRPYLSKFLGIILQFQLLEYYKQDWQYPNQSLAENIAKDENFLTMLRERSATDLSSLIGNYYAFYDLSANALLDYFDPLNQYLETAPLEQATTTTTRKPPTVKHQEPKSLKNDEPKIELEVEKVTLHPRHEHIEENLEGPNPAMEKIGMYVGIGLLLGVAAIIAFVVVRKVAKRKRGNNRRFET